VLEQQLVGDVRELPPRRDVARRAPARDLLDQVDALDEDGLLLVARVRRFLNGWVAAAIAYRERQVALLAPRQLDNRRRDSTRIYRGPIDDALERAARLRRRRGLKPS